MSRDTPEAYIYAAIRKPRGRGKNSGALHTINPVSKVSLVVGLIDEMRSRQTDVSYGRVHRSPGSGQTQAG